MDTLPEDLFEKIYRLVFTACINQMLQVFSLQCEHVSIYKTPDEMYCTYDPGASSYNPFSRNIIMGKGIFLVLRRSKYCPNSVRQEFDHYCAYLQPNIPITIHKKNTRQLLRKRSCLDMSDFEF